MQGNNVAVTDVECLNCWNAIHAVLAGRHYIARVQGQPINTVRGRAGLYVTYSTVRGGLYMLYSTVRGGLYVTYNTVRQGRAVCDIWYVQCRGTGQ